MSKQGSSGSENDPERVRGELSPEEREAFKRRASELGARLEKVRSEARSKSGAARSDNAPPKGALGEALRIPTELVVGIAVGAFVGKVLDDQFGTAPWLLIVFVAVGFVAALMNIIRIAKRVQAEAEQLQREAPAAPEDEEEDGKR